MTIEVYLDNSSTTKPRKEVVEAMLVPLTHIYGNPSSAHSMGIQVERMIKTARENISRILSCRPEEIIFTSGGTEANNIAVRGTALANKNRGNHIITTKFEHPSVLNTFKELEKEGYKVTYLDITREGLIDLNHLDKSLTDDTILVSIMYVNSEVGTIQPIEEAVKMVRSKSRNAKFHVDAVQAFTKINIDVTKLGIDMMTVSSHKIHGPKGVGALYVKKGTKVAGLVYGGSQETGLRPGTENVPGIVGFGKAAEIAYNVMVEDNKRIKQLRDDLEKKILSNMSDTELNGDREKRAPHILNISFLGVRGEVLLHALESKGIFVSTRSACSSHKNEPSHVLTAIGLKKDAIEGAIRFSLSTFNNQQDIDYCIEQLIDIVNELRKYKRR